jgi:hypothetical protein
LAEVDALVSPPKELIIALPPVLPVDEKVASYGDAG